MEEKSRFAEIRSTFDEGLQAQNVGDLSAAEQSYRKTLSLQPEHPEANHNIGIIFVAKNQLSKALKFFKLALESSPNVSLFWTSYIETLIGLDRIDEAKKLIKEVQAANISSASIEKISESLSTKFKSPNQMETKEEVNFTINYPAELTKWKSNNSEKKDKIDLSICIPTYNRAKYLDVLLRDLYTELLDFPFNYEIVISDDCSQDETDEVIKNWDYKLPIIYEKQKQNIGSLKNMDAAYSYASGTFVLYLADDDFIEKDGLIEALLFFNAHPDAVILYAPWKIIQLQNKNTDFLFYDIPCDVVIDQFDYANLLKLILNHHIFPEIMIFRLSAYKQFLPTTNDLSYWAFTKATEWLSLGKVIFKKGPFYCASNSYFENEERVQTGYEEVEYAWDRYRGGLEHILSFATSNLNKQEQIIIRSSINSFVAMRMWVALRMRLNKGCNPIDSYYLATRIRGMVGENKPLDYLIRFAAAAWYVGNDQQLLKNKKEIVLFGFYEEEVAAIREHSSLPVSTEQVHSDEYSDSILLYKDNLEVFKRDYMHDKSLNNRVLTELILMKKFK